MLKKMLLGAVAAVILSLALTPTTKASSLDIGPGMGLNVQDSGGVVTANGSGLLLNLTGGALDGKHIMGGSFALTSTLTAGDLLDTSGTNTFKLTGSLVPNSPAEAVDLEGIITNFTQDGTTLYFNFSVDQTKVDPSLATNFGPYGLIKLTLNGAPAGFNAGARANSFTAVGTSDVIAVPTPNASLAGLSLLGGLAVFRLHRSRKLSL